MARSVLVLAVTVLVLGVTLQEGIVFLITKKVVSTCEVVAKANKRESIKRRK